MVRWFSVLAISWVIISGPSIGAKRNTCLLDPCKTWCGCQVKPCCVGLKDSWVTSWQYPVMRRLNSSLCLVLFFFYHSHIWLQPIFRIIPSKKPNNKKQWKVYSVSVTHDSTLHQLWVHPLISPPPPSKGNVPKQNLSGSKL